MRRKFFLNPFFILCAVLVLAACSDSAEDENVDVSSAKSEMAAPPPPIDGLKPDEMALTDIKVPGATDSQKIENLNFRLLNLERQMTDIKGRLDAVLPPAKSATNTSPNTSPLAIAPPPSAMNTTPEDELRKQMMATGAMPPPSSPEAMLADAMSATEPAAAPVPPTTAPMAANVTGLRVGEHPGKSRIVLDVTGSVPFEYEIDNNERVLLVALPGAGWETMAGKPIKNPLIKGYSAQKNQAGTGTVLAIELAVPVKALSATSIGPSSGPSGDSGNRIVLDIAPL